MTMNAFVSSLYRDVTCAAAAILIVAVSSAAFVQSTDVPYGARNPAQTLTIAAAHATVPSWFGQPQPAVLVD
jgi:hypothetical protein